MDRGRDALDRRFEALRKWPSTRPPRGWLRAIRDALGMTMEQYAGRLGVSQPRIIALEKGEVEDTVTLGTLRRAAAALDCQLVYAVVPNDSLEQMFRRRAGAKAAGQMARVNHTMGLEAQGLNQRDQSREYARLFEAFLAGDPRRLWDEP
jgi:predicted DNA-binding mobile mystery protein A